MAFLSLSAILTVRLGSMLMYTPMDDDCQSLIKTHIQRFVKYAVELLFYLVLLVLLYMYSRVYQIR